jgi:hypothetical protein
MIIDMRLLKARKMAQETADTSGKTAGNAAATARGSPTNFMPWHVPCTAQRKLQQS